MSAIAHHCPNRIRMIDRFLALHLGVLEAGGDQVVRSWRDVEERLGDRPWISIVLDPRPAYFVPIEINGATVGNGWVPPCALFSFRGIDHEEVATLRIWLDKPQVIPHPGIPPKTLMMEAIANAFTESFA